MVYKCEGKGFFDPLNGPCNCYGCNMNRKMQERLQQYEDDYFKTMYGCGALLIVIAATLIYMAFGL